jgi:hypothetical protein
VYIWAGPNGRARSTKKKPGPSTARHEIISGQAGPARCIGPCLGRRRGPRAGTSPARLSRPELARLLARKGPKFIAAPAHSCVSTGLKRGPLTRNPTYVPTLPTRPPFFSCGRVPIRRSPDPDWRLADSHPGIWDPAAVSASKRSPESESSPARVRPVRRSPESRPPLRERERRGADGSRGLPCAAARARPLRHLCALRPCGRARPPTGAAAERDRSPNVFWARFCISGPNVYFGPFFILDHPFKSTTCLVKYGPGLGPRGRPMGRHGTARPKFNTGPGRPEIKRAGPFRAWAGPGRAARMYTYTCI